MEREALVREALKLSAEERAGVAAELLDSLDDDEEMGSEEIERAWGAEIERRARRVLSGESVGIPWEEAKQEARRREARPLTSLAD